MEKDDKCNHEITLDTILCILLVIVVLVTPFVLFVIVPTIGDFSSKIYYDTLTASKDERIDVLNGNIVFIAYGLPEGTYHLKPLEGYGSYIQTSPPFNDFVANGFIRMCLFAIEDVPEWSDGLVGLYWYGKQGVHVGKWVLGDIDYNPDVPPMVTVTLTTEGWLRYDFVVPAPEYVAIGNLNIDEMRKYMGYEK